MIPSGDLSGLLAQAPLAGALLFLLTALFREWVVLGTTYREARKDRDEWKERALHSMKVEEEAITLLAKRRA